MDSDPPLPVPPHPAGCSLAELPLQADAEITAVIAAADDPHGDLAERLAELGFLPGERVRIIARALFGEPLAVRVGTGTFALRRTEAACVRVRRRPEASRP
jgi:ferrous iron transport protein A